MPMLLHTFCHVPGVGPFTEQKLWKSGLMTWQELLDRFVRTGSPRLRDGWVNALNESFLRYENRDFAYFGQKLRPKDCWRLYHEGRSRCVYLDIETDAIHLSANITTAVLH